jgi:hypothetical protein
MRFEGPYQGAIGIAADIFILCLPIPMLRKLNLPTRKKYSLGIVFLVGILYVSRDERLSLMWLTRVSAVIVSVISMYYRIQIFSGVDNTWNTPPVLATA